HPLGGGIDFPGHRLRRRVFDHLFSHGDLTMVMRRKPKRTPPTTDEMVINIRGLVNRIGGNTIHDHLDLDVRRGEVLAIVGGSGSGKSVLLRSIIGLNAPTAGTIRVFGETVADSSPQHLRAVE